MTIRSLMIIDDNEDDHFFAKRAIRSFGLVDRVISYHYADEALQALENGEHSDVDVILLDVKMPRMSGIEFLASATESLGDDFNARIVVMLTTSMHPDDKARAETFSVVRDFLYKPLEVADVERIAALVDASATI